MNWLLRVLDCSSGNRFLHALQQRTAADVHVCAAAER